MRVLVMPVELDWYALPMELVDEVIERPRVTSIPTAPPGLLGVFNLRGEIVPLFATAALLGSRAAASGTHVVILHSPQGRSGLLIDHTPESAELEDSVAQARHRAGVAVYDVGARLVTLIDAVELLGSAVASSSPLGSTT